MGVKFISVCCAVSGLLTLPFAKPAMAQQNAGAGGSQALMAQNTYNGGIVSSQDSIMANGASNIFPSHPITDLRQEVAAAETNVNISAAFMHTQYHENFPPTTGDDENGYSAGFSVGASALLVNQMIFNTDFYTALSYEFSAGNLDYGGHYVANNLPLDATDRAVFNRIEARIGVGFPLNYGIEVIPFVAGGYQAWNRNIDIKGAIGTDEFYHSFLIGGGVKLDVPLTTTLVASATGEVLGLVGGGIALNNADINQKFGTSIEERLSLGLDYDVRGPLHIIGSAYWEAFNYAGSQPELYIIDGEEYRVNEPLSTTTQFGASVGVAYSF
jgi:hypothetical protein